VTLRFRDGEAPAVIGASTAPGGSGPRPKPRAKSAGAVPSDPPTQETLF
jgi:hypothetical protein